MAIIDYFAYGYTARGFASLLDTNVKGLRRLWVVQGGPPPGPVRMDEGRLPAFR